MCRVVLMMQQPVARLLVDIDRAVVRHVRRRRRQHRRGGQQQTGDRPGETISGAPAAIKCDHSGFPPLHCVQAYGRPNTTSIDAVAVFFSSGCCPMTAAGCREPTSTATNCLPFTA